MICKCGHKCDVIDSRNTWEHDHEKLRRRRYECRECRRRFSTVEVDETVFDGYRKRAIDAEMALYVIRKELNKTVGKDQGREV